MKPHAYLIRMLVAWLALTPALLPAQTVIQDNFTGASSTYSWTALHGACLTAGNATGSIPACVCPSGITTNCLTATGAYYAGISGATMGGGYKASQGGLPDPAGYGALRLTNGHGFYQNDGGLISNFTFPSANGLQVTFTTYAYGGDSGSSGYGVSDGADGMSFFLVNPTVGLNGSGTNPTYTAPGNPTLSGSWTPYDIGATGGSLGYDCSNETGNYKQQSGTVNLHPNEAAYGISPPTEQGVDGVVNAYVAVGMDEYGNFQNDGDNAGPQGNPPGVKPSAITVRGPGNVAWDALHAYNSTWYPSSLTTGSGGQRAAAVHETCSTGYYWNYSNPLLPVETSTPVPDYTFLSGVSLPTSSLIANESATQRYTSGSGFPSTTTGISAVPIQYTLTITSVGVLNLSYSYNGGASTSVISNADITSGGLYPLPAQYAFGFAGSIGGSDNIHEVLCFEAQPSTSASSSAGLNEKQAAEVQIGTQVYFAYYNPNTWAGSVTAVPVTTTTVAASGSTPATTVLSLGTPLWDGSCVLTGTTVAGGSTQASTCATTGAANSLAQPVAAASTNGRQIITYNTTTGRGVPFEWAGASGTTYLSSSQASALSSTCVDYTNSSCDSSSSTTTIGQLRLNYLRGDRTHEAGGTSFTVSVTSGGTTTNYTSYFRVRTSVLADIVDSSPTWVGPPQGSFGSSFADSLYTSAASSYFPENTTTTGNLNQYPTWAASVATRTNVVYVGANDGLLHGFSAGQYSNLTTYNASNTVDTGSELLAYMPGYEINDGSTSTIVDAVHDSQASPTLDLTSPNYGHNWFVDAAPGTGDLYYGSAWHTWLVGGYGPGGQGIFALDITNPNNFQESNAASLVVGEWTATTLPSCQNVGSCQNNLGNTYGVPQIRRFHNGQWGFVFGNGFGSATGDAGVFIALVNPSSSTPSISFYYLSTATGSPSSQNGIAYTTPADLDGDHIVDYIYAGDLQGHVWRFDVTSQNPANWAVSPSGYLFSTGGQPITTKPVVAAAPAIGGQLAVIVSFGTGRKIPQTLTASTQYASGTEDLYGIWDWNMSGWNSKSAYHYAALSGVPTAAAYGGTFPIITTSNLQQQTITDFSTTDSSGNPLNYATLSNNAVCWYGSSTCSSGNTQFGWYMALPNLNEQIVYNPTLQLGAFIVNSLIPAVASPLTCQSSNPSGYTYAINPVTGAGAGSTTTSSNGSSSGASGGSGSQTSFFGNPAGTINPVTGVTVAVSGQQLNASGTVSVLTAPGSSSTSGSTNLVYQTYSGTPAASQVNPGGNVTATRLTWKEIR